VAEARAKGISLDKVKTLRAKQILKQQKMRSTDFIQSDDMPSSPEGVNNSDNEGEQEERE
jgi:hypothetical protein